jgi:hypothetical protein
MASRGAAFGAHPVAVIEGVAIATVVLQHPNVDGVLGARDVSFQMPLPPSILAPFAILDASERTMRRGPRRLRQPESSCGTFVAHEGEKRWSAGSASVKQPSTKRPILGLSCGILSHS